MTEVRVFVTTVEPGIQRLFSDVLSRYGYEIVYAPDGRSALERLRISKPDIVFLDLELSDSQEALKYIHQSCPSLPVICLTDDRTNPHIYTVLRQGATACIVKPFNVFDILVMLEGFGLSGNSRESKVSESVMCEVAA